MFDVTTWLKTWTGALVACLLVLAVAAPSLRSGLCPGETIPTAQQGATAEATVLVQADDREAADVSGGEACQAGHCHHSPSLLSPLIGAKALVFAERIRLVPEALRMPLSNLSDGPNEPPRA